MKRFLFLICMLFFAANLSAQSVAVLEFEAGVGVSRADVNGISEIFNTYFRPVGITVVDRTKIDNVIGEWNFQRNTISEQRRVRIGKILNVTDIVVGTISIVYGNQYQVDTRVMNVETGAIVATSGDRFTLDGDYRSVMKGIATRLADQISIKPQTAQATISDNSAKKRDNVEVVLGYLKVYPSELGIFPRKPTEVIEQINNQHLYDYDTWRIPTDEELALLRANNYLSGARYMTTSTSKVSGVVLLVTDAKETYTQRIEREAKEQAARIEAERMAAAERERLAAEKAAADKAAAEEKARLAAEKAAADKAAAEEKEAARLAAEKAAAEEKARLAAERAIKIENRRKAYAVHQKGFGSMIDFNVGFQEYPLFHFGLTYTAGYHFNNYFYLGAGTGLGLDGRTASWYGGGDIDFSYEEHENNHYSDWSGSYHCSTHDCNILADGEALPSSVFSIPVFVYFKANLINRRWSPYFALAAGGNITGNRTIALDYGFLDYNTSSVFINPQFGVNFRTSTQTSIYFAAGFYGNVSTYCTKLGPDSSTTVLEKRFTPGAKFNIGVMF